ncbi:hypothetical protein UFOVP162_17 [uncultured Caudovirales phage]|uniref:Uncharacterized protein n=1 Tax=uncultured Caudovirales phage TaxID=2100421 RepID=A0A6J7XP02_9CAUD|nr:hypothetical protein UFOVP162_17 [uncultured Caudovirales phage]
MNNIEKSAFRKGEYVGYGGGLVWRIQRGGNGWYAHARGQMLCGVRLADLQNQLSSLE